MNDRITQIAALANASMYDAQGTEDYVDAAPHIKHASLRQLYAELAVEVYDYAARYSTPPRVLDMGAGEGSVTLPFLELGAQVTAVDVSQSQLAALSTRCEAFGDRLQIHCGSIEEVIRSAPGPYDIIVANSFLHHLPDYLGLLREIMPLLSPHGQIFSFQDPLSYASLGTFTRAYKDAAYLSWRLSTGDVIGGLLRRLRRSREGFLEDCMEDNAEYHATRGGMDQDAILELLEGEGFDCQIKRYFSTQSTPFQKLGETWKLENTFGVIARKKVAKNNSQSN